MGRRQLNVSRPLRYGPGRDALGPRRPAVPADGDAYDGDDYGGDDDPGTAGVREPRRPTPPGPLADAGALPEPEPPTHIVLANPCR